MIKKLFVPLIVLIASFLTLNAEYVFYKCQNANLMVISPEEHQSAYSVITKYQFPMSLTSDLSTLSKAEVEQLESNEEDFIRSKMPKGLSLAFIPTFLYDLLFFCFYLEDLNKSNILTTDSKISLIKSVDAKSMTFSSTMLENDVQKYHEFNKFHNFPLGILYFKHAYSEYLKKYNLHKRWNEKNYFKAISELNSDKFVKEIHNTVNNKIIEFLKTEDLLLNKKNILLKFVPALIKYIDKLKLGLLSKFKLYIEDLRIKYTVKPDPIKLMLIESKVSHFRFLFYDV
ncbi:MAG: hypothetical protein P4L22_00710, partial [Candidatus Babeliales bacterium]|nr:hypothetical protein [Candidatus Babeliales bacterium]